MTTSTPHQLRLFGRQTVWADDDDGDRLVGPEMMLRLTWTPCVRFLRLMERTGMGERELWEAAVNRGLRAMEEER